MSLQADSKEKISGFTLIELLLVIAIIGILVAIVLVSIGDAKDSAYKARAEMELRSLQSAMHVYRIDLGHYPDDVDRGLPSGFEYYLPSGDWPDAPWPGSVYDWDNWEDPDDSDENIVQITVRFCPLGGSIDDCRFPDYEWAEDFDVNSGFFYCIKGKCRSHIDRPLDYPGYCVNCPKNEPPFGFD
ncbi:MAG: type II secretion system protein [Patescibacteria group bacterium]